MADCPPSSKKAKLENNEELLSYDSTAASAAVDIAATGTTVNGNSKIHPESLVDNGSAVHLPFDKFSVDKVLFTDPRSKSIGVLGQFSGSQEMGIVVAEKQPLTTSSLPHLFSASRIEKKFQNDIYSQYILDCKEGCLGEMRIMTVYPASEKHIKKYGAQKLMLVVETPEQYLKITKPYAEKLSFSLDWVYNILDGKSEKDSVIYQDLDPETGFVLVPDLKWDQKETENLYVLAIVRRRGILSLRELRPDHLTLLRKVLEKGKEEISCTYGVRKDQLRAYLHYQPSYYHLHVHFTHIHFIAPKSGVGEAHLLEDIIDNISSIDPLYYAKRTLSFVLKESSPLWDEYAHNP